MDGRRARVVQVALLAGGLALGLVGADHAGAASGSFVVAQTWPAAGVLQPERIRIGLDQQVTLIDRSPRLRRFRLDGRAAEVLDLASVGVVDSQIPAGAMDADAGPDGIWYLTDGASVDAVHTDGTIAWRGDRLAIGAVEVTALARDPATGELVVLDNHGPAVLWLAADGGLARRIVLADPDRKSANQSAWADLDVDGRGRAVVLDRGNRRVLIVDRDGGTTTWSLDGPARRLAARADGAVFTLGLDGWVRWYSPSGERLGVFDAARWSLAADPEPSDLALDASGDVYVADRRTGLVTRYHWQASAADPEEPRLPRSAGCRLYPDAQVDPGLVNLGQPTHVRLVLRAACGAAPLGSPLDAMLVVETGRGLGDAGLDPARGAIWELVRGVDLGPARVGMITYDAAATVAADLSSSEDRLRLAALGVAAGQRDGARLDLGLTAARSTLEVRQARSAVPVVIILAHGAGTGEDSALLREAERLRGGGIAVYVLGLGGADPLLAKVATDARYFIPVEGTWSVETAARAIAAALGEAQLLRSAEITTSVSTAMRYVKESASPAASFDPATRILRWRLTGIPLSGLAVSYTALPLEAGRWPLTSAAWGDFVDGTGRPGRLAFPPSSLVVSAVAPPTATANATSTPATASPTRTATPAATITTPAETATSAPTPPRTPTPPRIPRSTRAWLPYAARAFELVSRPPTVPACLDQEREPNNTPEEALAQPALCPERPIAGTLPAGGAGQVDRDDYFRIEVDRPGSLTVDLRDIPAGSNFDLFVYDCGTTPGTCQRLGRSQSDLDREHIAVDVSRRRYYVRVWLQTGSAPSERAYRLEWRLR